MLHSRNNRLFSYGNKCSFLCKTFSLFLPCNMAAVQNLYRDFHPGDWIHSRYVPGLWLEKQFYDAFDMRSRRGESLMT